MLRQDGPQNFAQGLVQGQEQQQANALAQQKMSQEQEMNSLRVQQLRGAIGEQETGRKKQAQLEKTSMFRERLLRAPTPEAAREIVKMQYADPDVGPILSQGGTLEQSLAEVSDDPRLFERYKQQEAMGMSEWMKSQMPKVVGNAVYKPGEDRFVAPPEKNPKIIGNVNPNDFTPASLQKFSASGNYADLMLAKPVTGGGGGGGAAPTTKAPVGYRYTPSGDLEPIPGGPASTALTPKEMQKREATYPQATSSFKGFESKSDEFIKDLEKLRDDPGLNQITGAVYGRTPSMSREGSRAQSTYNKVFAKGGFQALQDMREASKTGGALGNVSNQEGERLEKSIVGGLDRTQNIADVKQGINDLISQIQGSKVRMKEAYDLTYGYKQQAPAADGKWKDL